ncbi:hypothetical protein L7F22_040201 [Adiantum nelumboides]|nr:hypothetical protein [Adiantum nelumboides]
MADDGETIDYCDAQDVFGACNDLAMENSFLDELLKGTHACTHTHTCNPPGPNNAPHTHTCIHTHTHLFSQQQQQSHYEASSETLDCSKIYNGTEDINLDASEAAMDISTFLKKSPVGNREAVKKYREKKKAHTAYLEEQVAQLRSLNQQLLRRLQGQAALEAEVYRLRTLLAEFRGRIDGELGVLYQKNPRIPQPLPGGYLLNSYSVPCGGVDMPCLHPSVGRDDVSAILHDTSTSGLPMYSCEKASTNCGKKRRRHATRRSNNVKMPDSVGDV